MAENKYVGKISNHGVQVVKAPVSNVGKNVGGKVKTGTDLRSGK